MNTVMATSPRCRRDFRIVRLVRLLSAGRSLDTDELCQRFGIHRRTVFRDIRMLREAGLNIVYFPLEHAFRLIGDDGE
jgi:predicted DNA-binding transcriptional regulator YafY